MRQHGMGEWRDLAPGCTGYYLVLVVGGGELGSSAVGGSGGGGELAPDPGGEPLQRPTSCGLCHIDPLIFSY